MQFEPLRSEAKIPNRELTISIHCKSTWMLTILGEEVTQAIKIKEISSPVIILWDTEKDLMGSIAYRVYSLAIHQLGKGTTVKIAFEKIKSFASILNEKLADIDVLDTQFKKS